MLGIPLWKLGTAIGIVLTLMGSCALRDMKIEQRGATKIVEASKERGKKINAKNETVRRRAAEPGAFERLLKHDCRDC